MYIVGFQRKDLNQYYDFENVKEEGIYKYICDIGVLKELSINDIQELTLLGNDYKTIIDTLDNIEEDYNSYYDNDYDTVDIILNLDNIPVKKLLNSLNTKVLKYISNIVSNIYELKRDIKVISYFYDNYDFEKDDIYLISKYDDFSIILSTEDNKFNIKSESKQINKIVEWVNYI